MRIAIDAIATTPNNIARMPPTTLDEVDASKAIPTARKTIPNKATMKVAITCGI